MGFVFHRGHTASRVLVRFRELPRAVAVWGCGRGAEVSEGLLAVCHGDARQGCRPKRGSAGRVRTGGPAGQGGQLGFLSAAVAGGEASGTSSLDRLVHGVFL